MKKIILLFTAVIVSSCNFFSKNEKKIDLIPYYQKDNYGYFDLEGKIVINPQFAFASAFRDDIALVRTTGENSKWGYIDKNGKYIINANYTSATIFQEGLAWVTTENSAPIAINKKGETLFILKQAEEVNIFSEGLAAYSVSDSIETKWGFVDKSGKVKINPQFKNVNSFKDGKCSVSNKEGKWGYIDESGKIIINFQFNKAFNFIDGKAVVYLDDKAGVINRDGKYIINPQFDIIYSDGDKFLVKQDDKIGWVDSNGKFTINPQFEDANLFGGSKLGAVKSGDQYGFIDNEGKIMINPQFEMALPFVGDKALVKSGDKFGVIDTDGKYLVNPQFDGLSYDLFAYLSTFNSYGTLYYSIESEYIDLEKIMNVINVSNPEKLSFNDSFQSIAKKMGKTQRDFNAFREMQILINNKKISNDASYSFGALGNNALDYSYYNYSYVITNNLPFGFFYSFDLKNKGYGKSENLQKALEKKFSSYKLVKKGKVSGEKSIVLKNNKHYLVIATNGTSNLIFYILNNKFDINGYLGKMTSESEFDESTEVVEATVEEAAPVVDSTAVDNYYYEGD
ncbi:WG repeat-containing protein [Flavobacterium sp.]|uniref:WG repeat-containing protein n=5 Tax=Flavobacterium sp. TaxID=239 RepID=UPI004048C2A2